MQAEGDRKVEMADEKFLEIADKKVPGDGMSEHDRTVLTRKILLKLDFRYDIPSIPLFRLQTEH